MNKTKGIRSLETRKKQSLAAMGNSNGKGAKRSKEWIEMTKKRMSTYKATEETKDKISRGRKGKCSGSDNPSWKGGRPKCLDCGVYITRGCVRCIKHSNRKGALHPRWIQNRNNLAKAQERNDSSYKEWRLNVYKRDNYKCRISNCDCSGKIVAHHILGWTKYPELRYNIDNGITLCQYHHPLKRKDEIELSPYFQQMVADVNHFGN